MLCYLSFDGDMSSTKTTGPHAAVKICPTRSHLCETHPGDIYTRSRRSCPSVGKVCQRSNKSAFSFGWWVSLTPFSEPVSREQATHVTRFRAPPSLSVPIEPGTPPPPELAGPTRTHAPRPVRHRCAIFAYRAAGTGAAATSGGPSGSAADVTRTQMRRRVRGESRRESPRVAPASAVGRSGASGKTRE